MKYLVVLFLLLPGRLVGKGADTLNLDQLIMEALRNNPEIKAAEAGRDAMEARALQSGRLENPELQYMREEMPGWRWNEAMYSRIELMQTFPFPGKLSNERAIAEIEAEHSHHDLMERLNNVLLQVRSTYFELWYAQQSIILNRESSDLLQQFIAIAQTRFAVGEVTLQDLLKAYVELASVDNQLIALRQQEQSAKAMLAGLLDRTRGDTLGVAVLPDSVQFRPSLDTLEQLALQFRPMLLHDSLSVVENERMISRANKEYLPDFTLGTEYVTSPVSGFTGWGIKAGITLPFAPWTLGRASAQVEEATMGLNSAEHTLRNSRNMVRSNVRDLYFKATAGKKQLENYSDFILPQTRQALEATLINYKTGKADALTVFDSYRMLVGLSMESLMLRMKFEQTVAELIRVVGYAGIFVEK
jgi:outer membrane protein TolC